MIFLALTSSFASSDFESLERGTGVTSQNINDLSENSWEYAYASDAQLELDDGWSEGFLLTKDSKTLYSLSGSATLYLINYDTKKLQNNWPLTRWDKEPIEQTVLDEYELYEKEYLEQPLWMGIMYPLACLKDRPLRYGDIEQDGSKELVLMIGNDLIVFSPDHQRTVFQVNMSLNTWMSAEDTKGYFEFHTIASDQVPPQYQQYINEGNKFPTQALRGYGKIYQGDFDQDGNPDLLIWRKLYRSNWLGEKDGFKLLSNSFFHYERDLKVQAASDTGITGEYLPQATDQATIQTWLSENELTWSKGFPSKSECEGEEGKLIPEMHDPLLNDPDVLQ